MASLASDRNVAILCGEIHQQRVYGNTSGLCADVRMTFVIRMVGCGLHISDPQIASGPQTIYDTVSSRKKL